MFFSAEALLKTYIESWVPAGTKVLSANTLTNDENGQPVPSIRVIYSGFNVVEQKYSAAHIRQNWVIVVTVENYTLPLQGHKKREDADSLCDLILSKLINYEVAPGYTGLRLQESPEAEYSARAMRIPFIFSTDFDLTGVC